MKPVRTVVRTRDQDAAVAAIQRIVEHRARIRIVEPDDVDFRISSTDFADWGADRVEIAGVRYAASAFPVPYHATGVFTAGHGTFRSDGRDIALGSGETFLHPRGSAFDVDYVGPEVSYLRIPDASVADIAEEVTGLPSDDLRFLSVTPVSDAMGAYWAITARFLVKQLNDPGADIPPLVAAQMLRLAAGSLLKVFPNTSMTAARVPGSGRAEPSVVRRAVAFMDANADRPLNVAQVAAAAGVGVRTLQAAFRKHMDTTPQAYLRRVRLERVHRELATHSGATVVETARRWGFTNRRRFVAEYRSAFGEPPTQTR